MVKLLKKGDKAVPGNCRGITLLLISTVGKAFCKSKVFCEILNDRMGIMLEKNERLSKG